MTLLPPITVLSITSRVLFLISALVLTFNSYATSPTLAYSLLKEAPHPVNYFTQGLVIEGDIIFESSGLYGKSFIRRLDRKTQQSRYYTLPKDQFVEGITVLGDTLYALTWKAETVLLLDKHSLVLMGEKPYKGEGWGLTNNGQSLIMSNGSNQLSFHKPTDFSVEKVISVNNVGQLNELEYHQGIIWANRWYEDTIYLISPNNGCVLGKIDIRPLRKKAGVANNQNVANGIAYDKDNNGFWLTGKFWPKQFLIVLDQPVPSNHQC